jgi:hypothetical protein
MSLIFFKIFFKRYAFSSFMMSANRKKLADLTPAAFPIGANGNVDMKSTGKEPLKT